MSHWVDPPTRRVWVAPRWWHTRWVPRLVTAAGVALLVGAVIVTVTLYRQKAQTDSFADPILALCHEGGDTADKLIGAGLCGKAAVAKVDQVAAQPDELSSEQADQVQALVQAELAKRKAPQPVAPTATQLAGAVQAFVAANPTMFKAPAPTAEQVQTAVNNYMRTHPVQTAQSVYPQYDMPGLGGFSGSPGGVWPQQWPNPRSHAAR